MNAGEDDDLKLQRSSAALLADIDRLLPRILHKRSPNGTKSALRRQVKETDLGQLFMRLERFQEDPQLLDTHLKTFIPPLVAAYLDTLQQNSRPKPRKGYMPLSYAICQILNLFCKVRGEKVIKGFLNNEPRYLEPILGEYEKGKNFRHPDGELPEQGILPWTERYVLLLWLSHLMLAPFPLASMSVLQSTQDTSAAYGIDLPSEVPGIALRTILICIDAMKSASKERGAAANLLVRLCVRPDMQKLGLMQACVEWALSFFSKAHEDLSDIHQSLGVLSFLAGMVASATNEEIGPFLPAIYQTCKDIVSQESLHAIKTSAVARKLIIKTWRNIVIHCLQESSAPDGLDTTSVIEEAIEFLLDAVADGDTLVRYSSSKALSIVTMKLDSEMAEEVVEAILGSMNENVYWQGPQRNLSGVNALRWHGLTLTLAHLLYRRAVPASQLPDILNALLLALAFEQRSATGGSIGTNVRDAACFGIWALARRYTTAELLAVQTTSVRASEHLSDVSILQVLATELLVVACLDPAGNIRRGSSAALQELVGRHPDTVCEGIPLVQVVDFHAVGLRERAMCDVAVKASELDRMYWEALFENFLGWRGTGSLDIASRLSAASAIGLLSAKQEQNVTIRMADEVCKRLKALKAREIEERQGFIMALSALAKHATPQGTLYGQEVDPESLASCANLTHLWELLGDVLNLEEKSFTSPALRPELTASAICHFLGNMATMSLKRRTARDTILPIKEMVRLLNLCLTRNEDSVLEAIPNATRGVAIILLLSPKGGESDVMALVGEWIAKLENEASYSGLRCSGYAIALGAAYSILDGTSSEDCLSSRSGEQVSIINTLTFRCTVGVAIEARTVALRALNVLLQNYQSRDNSWFELPDRVCWQIHGALHVALNDYTITERGDVGSLVRLEALSTTSTAWSPDLLTSNSGDTPKWADGRGKHLHADVLRLSMEKLDKMRARAAHVLQQGSYGHFEQVASSVTDGVSSYAYFFDALKSLKASTPPELKSAFLVGFVSSAGMGSESVVQNSRAALLDMVDSLPDSPTGDAAELSLLDVANCFLDLLKENLGTDRVLLPLLEVIAFLFDMQVMQRLVATTYNFRALLSYTQKAHFKSTHMQRLHLALDVYRGLASVPSTRQDTIAKLASMLLHPFPNIRISAAETLWILTQEEGLKRHDWSQPAKILRPAVEEMKISLSR